MFYFVFLPLSFVLCYSLDTGVKVIESVLFRTVGRGLVFTTIYTMIPEHLPSLLGMFTIGFLFSVAAAAATVVVGNPCGGGG